LKMNLILIEPSKSVSGSSRKHFGIISLFLLLAIVYFQGATEAASLSLELTQKLRTLGPEAEIPVIVRLTNPADLSSLFGLSKRERRISSVKVLQERGAAAEKPVRAFLKNHPGSKTQSLWIINGLAVTAPARVIRLLAALPQIQSVQSDTVFTLERTPALAVGLPEWNLTTIQAPSLWNLGYTGQGVVVANLDTGVDVSHPDLATRWRGGSNSWYDPNGQHAAPYDAEGHGTQTMGLLVGGDAGGTSIGVAPGAQWIAVKIFNDAGSASLSAIHAAFQWLLDPDDNPDTPDAPDIVNNSWGFPDLVNSCDQQFELDIQALRAAGIAVVFGGGNASVPAGTLSTSIPPANNPGALAVGYTDLSKEIVADSSRGPSACGGGIYPHLVAPGSGVLTSDLNLGIANPYTTVFGSSFAAPQVAGVLALLLSAYPNATVVELEQALQNSAQDLGSGGPDNTYGFGLVDALRAYSYLSLHKIYLPLIFKN
jgi:subtilisin family serine protease